MAPALGCAKSLTEPFEEDRAVYQTREPIGAGQQGDFFLRGFALRNVDDDAFDLNESSIFVAHGDVAVFDRAQRPVPGAQAKLDRRTLRVFRHDTRHRLADFCHVGGIDESVCPSRRSQQRRRVVSQFGDVVRDVNEGNEGSPRSR
jgi:hypothetical protein